MTRPSWRARLRYRFDNTISRGTTSLVAWLALLTGALIVIAGVVLRGFHIHVEGEEGVSLVEALWVSLIRALDPAAAAHDTGWTFRFISLAVTIGGIFIVSALIGLLATALDHKIEELRKGRSPVLETGHTLILGWTPKLFAVITELVVANQNRRNPCIVVMAHRDKVEMEDALRARLGDTGRTRIVCRTGEPSSRSDLDIVAAREARSIIVLCDDDDTGDAEVVRTVLALMSTLGALDRSRVVAELSDSANAKAVELATHGKVATVVSSDIIARITAQACRQSGLSVIYQELMDFEGDEIYVQPEPALVGRTFADALLSYEDSAVIGMRFADGRVVLSPPMDTRFGEGDGVIAISRDDDTVVIRPEGPIAVAPNGAVRPPDGDPPEKILMVGWNPLGPRVLRELDHYVASGSRVDLLVDPRYLRGEEVGAVRRLRNLEIDTTTADMTTPEPLAAVMAARGFDHVIILCYRKGVTAPEADARTLLTLLQLRDVLADNPGLRERLTVVSELLDVRDVELARVTEADDFIVSERLTSLMLAQLAENLDLEDVFEDLFNPEGVEIRMRPMQSYVAPGRTTTFAAAVAAALARGEIAIGYRQADDAHERDAAGIIALNPRKSEPVTFGPGDQLIVLSTH